jgi:hypothetical protein
LVATDRSTLSLCSVSNKPHPVQLEEVAIHGNFGIVRETTADQCDDLSVHAISHLQKYARSQVASHTGRSIPISRDKP